MPDDCFDRFHARWQLISFLLLSLAQAQVTLLFFLQVLLITMMFY